MHIYFLLVYYTYLISKQIKIAYLNEKYLMRISQNRKKNTDKFKGCVENFRHVNVKYLHN